MSGNSQVSPYHSVFYVRVNRARKNRITLKQPYSFRFVDFHGWFSDISCLKNASFDPESCIPVYRKTMIKIDRFVHARP
jgi:hypothetical protein